MLVNGREFFGPVNVVRKATLGEISFVDLGADGQTSASVAAAATPLQRRRNSHMEDSTTIGADTQTVTACGSGQPAGAGRTRRRRRRPPAAAAQPARPPWPRSAPRPLAETNRIAAIRADLRRPVPGDRGPGDPRGLGRRRAASWRSCGPAARRPRPCTSATAIRSTAPMLEAACLLTAKLDGVENLFDEPDAGGGQPTVPRRDRPAGTAPGGGLGQRLHGRNFRDSRAVLRFAFQPELEAGFSTDRHRRHPLQRGQQVPAWKASSRSSGPGGTSAPCGTSRDFKTVTSYRLIGNDQYEQVAAGRGTQARHAGQRDLHQQGRHLRPDALDRPPRHHQRRPGRHHHGAPEAGPRLGPEDQRRLLGHVPEQRRVLHRGQQELPDRRGHGAGRSTG